MEIINSGLAFAEGFVLIVSPCILPILPIILATSLTGSKRRPIGIVVGFIVIFALFTLLSKKLVTLFGIDLNIVRNTSFVLLFLLGIIMTSDSLMEMFSLLTQRLANISSNILPANQQNQGFISGLLFGGLIGLVWTPCAGPILAAVILQTVLQKTNILSVITIFSFSFGIAVPMLIIIFWGRAIIAKFSILRGNANYLRKILGFAVMASVLYMSYGYYTPFSLQTGDKKLNNFSSTIVNALHKTFVAPPISNIDAWINSKPLQISELKGKVILVDFWTYSCINCIRTIPHLIDLDEKYRDNGLVIIGVHSPEFDFEKQYANVANAVKKYGIKYPVALDNNFATWQNFNNSYWPADYLIDKNGYIVYQHFGEGSYDEIEHNIKVLLGISSSTFITSTEQQELTKQTPETYLGYFRKTMYSSNEPIKQDQLQLYTYPNSLLENSWALQGKWIIAKQKIIAEEPNATLKINFTASKVYAVLGNSSTHPIVVKLLLNGKPVLLDNTGSNEITVTNYALYSLLSLPQSSSGILELIVSAPGLEIYTFTFGSDANT